MQINILTALSQKPENLDFVLPGLVAGTVGALVSPGGSGKSALALQIAAFVAGGPDLFEIGEIVHGGAAYLPGEDPEIAVMHRLFALGEQCSPAHRASMSENLYIESLEKESIDIMQEKWFDYIKGIAENRRILILDTLRMVHTLDENDSGAMTQVIGKMKLIAAQTRCAIVFLHHTSKASATSGAGAEQQASRGSSVLVDNIRWQAYLKNMTEAEAKKAGISEEMRGFYVEFGISKQNYGKPYKAKFLRKISAMDKEIAGGYTLQKAHLKNNNNNNKGAKHEFDN